MGKVSDEKGKYISSVKVIATGETGNRIHAETTKKGNYTLVLPPGKFSINFEKKGVSRFTLEDFVVKVGKENLDVILQLTRISS